MKYLEEPKITIKLNSRAKIVLHPIREYSNLKGYEIKLLYWVRNKFIKKYLWKEINRKNIQVVTILQDEEEMNKVIDSLFDRERKLKRVDRVIKSKLSSNIKYRWSIK